MCGVATEWVPDAKRKELQTDTMAGVAGSVKSPKYLQDRQGRPSSSVHPGSEHRTGSSILD